MDLQSNLNICVKQTLIGIMNTVLSSNNLDSTTRTRYTKMEKWVTNYFDSLNLGDILKVTLHYTENNGRDGINKINNLTYPNLLPIDSDGSDWKLWPEVDS